MTIYLSDVAKGHNNNFNIMRMLASTGVLISHAYPLSLGRGVGDPIHAIFGISLGTACVMIFFCISGFFVAGSFEKNPSVKKFILARSLRLFPALFVCLIATILLASLLTESEPRHYWSATPQYFFYNFTLFFGQNELPGVFKENIFSPTINGSLWTLNFEVMLYFIVLALGVSGFLAKKKKFLIFLAVFLSLLLLSKFFEFPYRANLILKLGYPFMSGVVFWVWRRSIPFTISFTAGSAIYITISCFLPLPHFTIWIAATYIIFFLGYSEIPSLKIYNRFGDYSYGVYIYAFPIQQIYVQLGTENPLQNIALSLPTACICAVLSWHFIESPALRLKHKNSNVKKDLA